MRNDSGQTISRYKEVGDILRELVYLKNEGKRIGDDPDLLRVIEELAAKYPELKIEKNKLVDIAYVIDKLNSLKTTEEENVVSEESFGESTVPTAKIRELVEEYEKHLTEGLDHEKAVELVSKTNKGLVSKKNVAVFLERQRSIYQEVLKSLATESKLKKEETEHIATVIATERLLVEEKLAAVGVDRVLAEKAVLRGTSSEEILSQIAGSTKGIGNEEVKKYAQEVLAQGAETINSRIEISQKIEAITQKLVESLQGITPDEVARNKTKIEAEIRERIGEQIRGESRLEEGLVEVKKEGESQKRESKKMSEQIIEILGLPPSKRTVVEKAIGAANVQIMDWSDNKTEAAVDTILSELINTSEMAAAAKVREAEIRRVTTKEIEAAIYQGRSFDQVAERVAEILDPSLGKKVAVEIAVEKATRAEIKSPEWNAAKTEQAIKKLLSELSVDGEIAVKISSVETQLRAAIKTRTEGILAGEARFEERTREFPSSENLAERITRTLNLSKEKISQVNLAIKNTGLSIDQLILSDKENVKKIRVEYIREKVEQGFVSTNRKLTVGQAIRVHNYATFVGNFYADANLDIYKKDAVAFAESRGISPGAIKNAWGDVAGMSKILQMSPKQFKLFQKTYFKLRGEVSDLKMPFGVTESRSLDGLMRLTQEVPQIKNLLTFTQNFTTVYSFANKLTGGFLTRIGLEKVGMALFERIGGQAMGEFVRQALVVVAENGTQRGLMMILKGVLGGGVKAAAVGTQAGTAAAGAGASGALAGAVAAFQAIPVVGQIILVVAMAVMVAIAVYKNIIRPVLDKLQKFTKSFTDALGIDFQAMEIVSKKFINKTFGKFFGGIIGFASDIVRAPAIILGAITLGFIAPLIMFVFIGLSVSSLDLDQKASSLVPRGGPGATELYGYDSSRDVFVPGQVLPTRDPSIVLPESCPGIWPTISGVITQGPLGPYSHYRTKAQAIDIGVGVIPIMATHNGWATPAEDGISGYGYYVDVEGKCNGINFYTRYAHMPGFLLTTPKMVKQGDVIGYVDTTGNSTGNHLHYELFGLGPINNWLPKPVAVGCDSDNHPCGVSIP